MNCCRSIVVTIICLALFFAEGTGQTTSLVSTDASQHLSYKADAVGTVVPDFSGVGYFNSEKSIPTVPVVKTVSPVAGDNVTNVQNAINEVSARPLVNGFRGAILFKSGTYDLSQTINVTTDGVVIRGEGDATVFRATGTVQYDLLNIAGAAGKTDIVATQKRVTDAFVPVGAKSVTVESGHSFVPGDWVHLRREPNDAWIHMLGMDTLSRIDPAATNWTASTYKVSYERKITDVQGNVITFDAPVMDIIDPAYAKAYVVKFTSERIQNCAVEKIKMTSTYASSTDEQHGWRAVFMDNAENCWAKKVNAYSFGYSCVDVGEGCAFVTVDSCSMYDPVSVITGGRRYSFLIDGQRSLVQNCTTRNGRHDYVDGSRTPGPSVFYNCSATLEHADIGPHHRWSTGILFDNITTDGQIRVQDRADSGSGHGWSGAQIMFWNCVSPDFVVQDPPSYHCNWAIGCVGPITNVGQWTTNPLGIVESKGVKIAAIPSLFKAQLNERLKGSGASVKPIAEQPKLKVCPTPANNEIELHFTPDENKPVNLTMFDFTGRYIKSFMLKDAQGVSQAKINVSDLTDGTYFIRLTSGKWMGCARFIVLHHTI